MCKCFLVVGWCFFRRAFLVCTFAIWLRNQDVGVIPLSSPWWEDPSYWLCLFVLIFRVFVLWLALSYLRRTIVYLRRTWVIPSSYVRHTFAISASYLCHSCVIPLPYTIVFLRRTVHPLDLCHTFVIPALYSCHTFLYLTFVIPSSYLGRMFVIPWWYFCHTSVHTSWSSL